MKPFLWMSHCKKFSSRNTKDLGYKLIHLWNYILYWGEIINGRFIVALKFDTPWNIKIKVKNNRNSILIDILSLKGPNCSEFFTK